MTDCEQAVRERLLRYAAIPTQSKADSAVFPTTECQKDLAAVLYEELQTLGCTDVYYDEAACVVYGKIPSNLEGEDRPFGLIAHMDTSPDVCGDPVRPWVLEGYDGGDILLNEAEDIRMRAADFPNLAQYIGQDLVLTDGTSLLGGDDKASIAAIMTLAEYLHDHPEEPHGTICLAFTPDEEVGGLAKDLDLERFGAKVAYTMDGDHLGWYQEQTFNAAQAYIEITGRSVHPGTAKGIMVNAADMAAELLMMLPKLEKPQYTEGTEGYYHVICCNSDCERAEIRIILRDFDRKLFERRKSYLSACVRRLGREYGEERVHLRIEEEYRNMGEVLKKHPYLVENLRKAIEKSGLTPHSEPFRGGTDGAALSFRGLPCPNLSAGYENAHSRFEFVPVQSMAKNVEILRNLCALFAKED